MYVCNNNKEKEAINLRGHGKAPGKGWRKEKEGQDVNLFQLFYFSIQKHVYNPDVLKRVLSNRSFK